MTQRQRYSDNRYLIEKYRHYLSRFHELDAVKGKNDWMINEADQIDQENLIREMSRLLEINETIRNKAITDINFLDEPYEPTITIVSAQFNTAGSTAVEHTALGRLAIDS